MVIDNDRVRTIARVCHEANRAWCFAHGDRTQPQWVFAPTWQRESAIKGVEGALAGNTPEQSHDAWLRQKAADGWVYGPTKDPDAKTHPCMVAYDQLPEWQRDKDRLFVAICRALGGLPEAESQPASLVDAFFAAIQLTLSEPTLPLIVMPAAEVLAKDAIQWFAHLADGRDVYIRLGRYDAELTWGVGDTLVEAVTSSQEGEPRLFPVWPIPRPSIRTVVRTALSDVFDIVPEPEHETEQSEAA